MAKRQRDYKAEYAARRAREQSKGFKSPREATKLRSSARKSNPETNVEKLSPAELRELRRLASQARRVTKGFARLKFDESKKNDPEYVDAMARYADMVDNGGKTEAQRRAIVLGAWGVTWDDLEFDTLEDYYDDGGSVPE